MSGPNEAQTRKQYIDKALSHAGWDISDKDRVGIEIPVDKSMTAVQWRAALKKLRESRTAYNASVPRGISDYLLYEPNGEVIAVVEAKKTRFYPN